MKTLKKAVDYEDSIVRQNPLDIPIHVTVFANRRALRMKEGTMSVRELAARIANNVHQSKDGMRHIKLARFSGEKTERGSYRHNSALLAVSGIECDYDAGEMSVEEAAVALEDAGVAAFIYTTPSHQQDENGNRWRILCPFSQEITPAERAPMVARINGLLGNVLARESFTASQSFAFGAVAGKPPPVARTVNGRFLDLCTDLDECAIGTTRLKENTPGVAIDLSGDAWKTAQAARMLDSAAERLSKTEAARNASLCREAYLAGGLLANRLVTRDQVTEAFLPAMVENGYLQDHAGGNEAEVERIIDAQLKAGVRKPFDPAVGDEEWDDDTAPLSSMSIAELLGEDPVISKAEDREAGFLEAASIFDGVVVPAREWMVPALIPHRTVSLLGGDGGTGKSLLALQLAVAAATGIDWIGHTVQRPGPVVYISAEDERDELHRRMASVTEAFGISFSDLPDLLFRSLAGEGAILADLDRRSGKMRRTNIFKKLETAISSASPGLVVLDTLADLHSGDQNDQSHARQFITLLRGLCVRYNCTVLLLAHPSLSGITSGTGTGGSMAWNNSVRSRLYLRRVKENGCESDADARILETMKSNYGRIGGQITLRWRNGVFDAVSEDDEAELQVKAEMAFLRLLDEATEAGQRVSPYTGANYAPALFEAQAKTMGIGKSRLVQAMKELLQDERLSAEKFGPPSRQTTRLVRSHGGFTGG